MSSRIRSERWTIGGQEVREVDVSPELRKAAAEFDELLDNKAMQQERDDALAREERLREALADMTAHRDAMVDAFDRVSNERERLREAVEAVIARPMPGGNSSCATEIERIKQALRKALTDE